MSFRDTIGRRTYLRTVGAGVVALGGASVGVASGARSHEPARTRGSSHTGEPVSVGAGYAQSYVEREGRGRSAGDLSAIGVRFDAGAMESLPPTLTEYHLGLPGGDTGPFAFVGVDWNPEGHPPVGVFTDPHFDFHFYFLDEATVEAIGPDEPTYELPPDLMPADTTVIEPREVVPAMGEHLLSTPASLPQEPGTWSVYIWGAYDPDGDGVGQLTFMEPMTTLEYFAGLGPNAEVSSAIPMPARFHRGGRYPTEFVVRSHGGTAYTVSLESFERFPGYGRR